MAAMAVGAAHRAFVPQQHPRSPRGTRSGGRFISTVNGGAAAPAWRPVQSLQSILRAQREKRLRSKAAKVGSRRARLVSFQQKHAAAILAAPVAPPAKSLRSKNQESQGANAAFWAYRKPTPEVRNDIARRVRGWRHSGSHADEMRLRGYVSYMKHHRIPRSKWANKPESVRANPSKKLWSKQPMAPKVGGGVWITPHPQGGGIRHGRGTPKRLPPHAAGR